MEGKEKEVTIAEIEIENLIGKSESCLEEATIMSGNGLAGIGYAILALAKVIYESNKIPVRKSDK